MLHDFADWPKCSAYCKETFGSTLIKQLSIYVYASVIHYIDILKEYTSDSIFLMWIFTEAVRLMILTYTKNITGFFWHLLGFLTLKKT